MTEEIKEGDLPKKKTIKGLKDMFKAMKGSESATGGLSLMFSALELLEPILMPLQVILEIIGALFAVMAGEILPPLMEALEPLFDMLLDLMPFFKDLGAAIGQLLAAVLPLLVQAFKDIFTALTPLIPIILDLVQKLLPILIEVIVIIVNVIVSVLKPILEWLSSLSPGQLAALMYTLFVGMAFFYGMMHAPGPAGIVLGLALAGLVAAVMSPMLSLQEGGILTRPTVVEAGHGGGEVVAPLDEWRDSNEEIVYALEDQNDLLQSIDRRLYFANRKVRGAIR